MEGKFKSYNFILTLQRRMLDCASVVVTRVKRALRVSKLPHLDTEQQHQASSSTEARYREMPC